MIATAKNPMKGLVIGEHYQIDRCLKEGVKKSTYFCRDLHKLHKRLVLKIINISRSRKRTPGAWSQEFSLLQRLRHPNLASILDFGKVEKSDALYFVEEWTEGKDLYSGTEDIDIHGKLYLLEALFRTVCFLHNQKIVHGNLRPSNIVLSDAKEGALRFKLTDFGMSGLYNGGSDGELKESLPYRAPELLLGGSPDTGSDLYSLGVLSYLIFTRRLPFEDEDPGFLMQKHLQGSVDLRPVERLRGGKYLAQLLQVLLEKDATKRLAPPEEAIRLIHSALKDDSSFVNGGDAFEGCFSATRMVGREKEMECLRNCAERVKKSGRGWTVFVSGEAGLGKTRCMEELKSWGNLEGWRVIEGSCSIQEEGSYGPYRQILAGAQPGRNEEVFNFGETLHNERSGAFESSMDYAAGQFRDFLTRELVRHLSKRPTLLLLEDFHEADEATSIVLDYLSSDIQAHPVLMCVSLRSEEEFDGALGRVIASVVRQNRGEVVALKPLSQGSVEELVSAKTGAPQLSKTLGSWMFLNIGGNPFFLEEMLKHFVEQGLLWSRSGKWQFNPESPDKLEVPDSIGMVIKRRLGRLSAASRELADWMALINRGISTKLLCSVSSLKPSEIVEALYELVHRQIAWVEIKDKEETAGFRHALIAEVIRSCLLKKKRQWMHRRIAEAFEREYGVEEHLPELARHSMEGKLGEKAIGYALSLASRARMEFSHEVAVRCFDFVLSDRSVLSKEERCRVSIEASDTLLALGLPKRAIRLLKKEIAENRNIDVDLKGRMFMQLALSFQHLGDFVSQEIYCKRGLRLFRGSSNSGTNITKAMLYAELAFGAAIQSRPRRGLVFLEKALNSCPDSGATALLGRIQSIAAFLHRVACNLHKSLISSKKAADILSRVDEYYLTCSAYSTLGAILMHLGRFSQALEKHKQAVRISDTSRSVIPRAQALGNLTECLCRMGRTQEALNVLEEAMKLVGETKNPAINHALNTILAEVRIAEGDYSSAYRIIRKIGNKVGNNRASYAVGQAHYLSASLHFLLGNFDAAVASVDLLRRMETPEAPCYEHELAEALSARILFERGKKTEAVKRLRSLERAVTKKRWPYQMAIIKLHLGEILTKQGEPKEAARNIRNALRLANAMQSTPLMSYGHLLMGSLYSREWRDGLQGNHADFLGKTVSREPASLHRAIEEFKISCRLTETSGHKEVAWRAHAELCAVYGLLRKEDERLQHAKAAYDCLCKLENHTPAEMLPAFWNAFNRSGIKSELARLIGSAQGTDPGMDIVVSGGHEKDQTRILYRVSAAVNSIRDLDPLLETILDQLIQAMAMERALVFLKEGSSKNWKMVKGRTSKRRSITTAVDVSPALQMEVGIKGNPVVSADVQKDPRLKGRQLTIPGEPGRLLCAPLKVSGKVIGLLYTDRSSPAGKLDESAINLFAAFCNLSAIAIDNSIAQQKLFREKVELEQYLHNVREEYSEIVGESLAAEALRDRIAVVAESPLDVLITGESGTGKELVLKAIHRTGRRSSGKLVTVDCGSLSDSLAEAELFGYRKGAFTGALENRQGLLEAANGGILFLDEISNLQFRLQAKLLRVLEEREVRRVGETAVHKIDIQVIAATNRDLPIEIETGRFREDLYYRLKKMEILVPPLRERLEDIPLLVQRFLRKTADNVSGRQKSVATRAMSLLKRYPYPGNIRELLNIVSGSYHSAKGDVIDIENLPPEVRQDYLKTASSESNLAEKLYRDILDGRGRFEDRVKQPFLKHQFSASVVRGVIQRALRDANGRYRDAFGQLRIPDRSYAATLQFLKRHQCYLDFRPFRRRKSDGM